VKPIPGAFYLLEIRGGNRRAKRAGRVLFPDAVLSYWVEQTIVQGKEFYPPERTLLATEAIEAIMDSSFQRGRKVDTPHLDVRYRAQESRFMRGPLPPYDRIRV
jgi:hypothetical protein